jgi:tRNA-specific adenosine deaminase 3
LTETPGGTEAKQQWQLFSVRTIDNSTFSSCIVGVRIPKKGTIPYVTVERKSNPDAVEFPTSKYVVVASRRMDSSTDPSNKIRPPANQDVYKIDKNDVDYFVEILRPDDDKDDLATTVEASCILVEPKACNSLIKDLTHCLPLEQGLLHLKRVRKQPTSKTDKTSTTPPPKRPKIMLQVLLGTSIALSPMISMLSDGRDKDMPAKDNDPALEMLRTILAQHGPIFTVMVPKCPPQSEQEWKESNAIWPTQYYPLKTAEHQKQQKALSLDELQLMRHFVQNAIREQIVLIVDPQQRKIVADSNHELQDRINAHPHCPPIETCLTTPILLAIQGVSRRERESQLQKHHLPDNSNDAAVDDELALTRQQPQNQYLCTGYDMYCYYEPSIFEAMSCLHSRLRRLVYCKASNNDATNQQPFHAAVWRNGCSRHFIHDLPGTNHRYRVFEYRPAVD